MPSRRKFVAGLGAASLASAASLALPASALYPTNAFAQTQESALARVKRTGVLRTGFIAGAAPYFTKSVATGEWQGFCVELSHQLADSMGVKLQYIETTWGNAVLDLQSNKIDCMLALGPTPQRMKSVGFTNPLFQNTFTLVARNGFTPKTWEEANRAGLRYSVDIGSNQDAFASDNLKNATLRRFDTSGDATLALQTGQVDAQVLVVVLAATVLAKQPALGHLVMPQPLAGSPTSIGVQKETDTGLTDAINAWLAKMHASGAIKKSILDAMQSLVHIDPSAFPKEVTF